MLIKRPTKRYSETIQANRGIIAETGTIPNGMCLLRDTWRLKPLKKEKAITESAFGKEIPIWKVTGLFQEADILNANTRIYPYGIVANAVDMIQEDIANRSVLGELDHPQDAKVNLDRVSHLVTKVWMDGKKVYGEAEILHRLFNGQQLLGLFEHKAEIGISSRGIGDMEIKETKSGNVHIVSEGYMFVTWDTVAEPSVKNAILKMQPMKESKRAIVNGHVFTENKNIYDRMILNEIKKQLKI